MKEVQEKIKTIVSYFHQCVRASDKLPEIQHRNVKKKLIMDVETRCNSTYYVMELFLEQHEVITNTLLAG